jgi:hypothetical protein
VHIRVPVYSMAGELCSAQCAVLFCVMLCLTRYASQCFVLCSVCYALISLLCSAQCVMLCSVCYALFSVLCSAQCVMLCTVCYALLSVLCSTQCVCSVLCVCSEYQALPFCNFTSGSSSSYMTMQPISSKVSLILINNSVNSL